MPSSGEWLSRHSKESTFRHSKADTFDIIELHYPRQRRSSETRQSAWPLVVIGGQLFLLAIAYGFYAALHVRGQIPLYLPLSDFAQRNPQSKTYIVTFLATGLSALSSYLFSRAVRHAILVCLARPTSVSTLGFGILISRRSPIFRRRQLKWVFAGSVFFLATLGQTASWTSLVTPIEIVISTPLQGTEIDFFSDAFSNQFDELWNGTTNGLQSYIDSAVLSIMDISGAADATSATGSPSLIDFNNWLYSSSTRGVLPITLVDSADLASKSNALVTVNTEPFPGPTVGDSFNYSMMQQGLSATTSCQYQELDMNTNPPLQRFANSVEITVGDQPTIYTAVGVATTCNGQTLRSDVLSSTNNTLLSVACGGTDDNGVMVYTVIFDGQGLYDGTVVCEVVPTIIDINVAYSGQWVYSYLGAGDIDPPTSPSPTAAGYAGIYGLEQALAYGQSATHNFVGDSINTILADQDPQQSSSLPYVVSYELVLEVYITGVVEFVGTAVKTDLASSTGPTGGDIPSSMRREIVGFAQTKTFGWEHNAGVNNAILIPSTFVALASILIVLVAQCIKWARSISLEHVDFDPNDPLLLMAAASAGGMGDTFHGITREDLEEGGRKKVVLAQIGDREGLVQIV
ncbi:hypothetical protein C8R44DRAFT_880669 [Mycena epipterygia]|nr:hypothetical protein C8R44DRAFT_880669 [Mycena epipterygia]